MTSRRSHLPAIEKQCQDNVARRSPVRRTPTFIQMEAAECGAASLGIVLAHYGRYEPLETLRVACGVSRDGSSAKAIVDAAATYGLRGVGMRMEIPPLIELGRPVIIFWAFQHFMVVNGFERRGGRTRVLVNDPATGPRRMSLTEFDEGFTGIVIDFEPTEDFEPGGEPDGVFGLLRERTTRTGRGLPLAIFASLVLVIPGVVAPLLTRYYFDSVYGDPGLGPLVPLLLLMASIGFATAVLTNVQLGNLRLVEARTTLVTGGRFMFRLLRLPMAFFLQRRAGELGRRVASNAVVARTVTRDLVTTVINLVLITGYGAVLLWQDPILGLLAIFVASLNLVVLRAVMHRRIDAAGALDAEEGRLAVATINTIASIETVKSSGTESASFTRWSGFLARTVSESQRLGVPTAALAAVPPALATTNSALVMTVGGMRVADGAISVGLLFAFQLLLASFTRPLTQLTNQAGQLQDLTAQLRRLRDADRYSLDRVFDHEDGINARLAGSLEMRDVVYTFGPLLPPLIRGLDLHIDPGMRVALVGASGSGKSTVGKLAAGLLEANGGDVVLDGRPMDQYSRQALAASRGYVDQTTVLFEGTVRDNITLWDPDVPDEAVVRALSDAGIYDEVSRRPGGVNAKVAEAGRNFSGGQRQRLEIARALVGDPALLVLDEATSALDTVAERIVMDNLRRRGCALLLIAHRLSTVRDADRILVMSNGEVVEAGRHEELMLLGGEYAMLVRTEQEAAR